jgi:bifunctional non-homologous end joining protein LigD
VESKHSHDERTPFLPLAPASKFATPRRWLGGKSIRVLQFIPQLRSKSVPFDHCDYLYELKYDGLRAFAYPENGRCRLVSRNGTTFSSFSFCPLLLVHPCRTPVQFSMAKSCALIRRRYPQFNDLLFHRAEPCFLAFDILSCDGKDLRWNALVERKAELRRLLVRRAANSRVCYADHVERDACRLFELICQRDLEGIVAKLKHGHYTFDVDDSTWVKIKNRNCSQSEGRGSFSTGERNPCSRSTRAGIPVR